MPDLDILIYGATGFTGELVAEYLATNAPDSLRWAVAGRNAAKLAPIAEKAGVEAIIADSSDPASVSAAVARARVVIAAAGPFAKYGDPVVDACVEHGAHYVDITGESPWIRRVIDRHHETAKAQGTRIVNCCGYDSIPSDMGAFMMARALAAKGLETARVDAYHVSKGGVSGGTVASMLNLLEMYTAKELANPMLLNPDPKVSREVWAANADPRKPVWQPALERWGAPFFMGPINTRVVRRSAALFAERQQAYGPDFAYQEYMEMKSRGAAVGLSVAMGGMLIGMYGWGRALIRRLTPAPGEGPDRETRDKGMFRVRYVATATDGSVHLGECFAKGDPGYQVTCLMLCQAAMCLALDGEALGLGEPGSGGVLTPATAMGDLLLDRLRAAGMRWEVKAS